jgi:hypothetical protein
VGEISWKKHHNYLTLVVNHTTSKVVWGAEGRDAKTLYGLFDEFGQARSGQIRAVSMDMGPAFRQSVTAEGHAPQTTICFDPFHVVKLGTDGLNAVRRVGSCGSSYDACPILTSHASSRAPLGAAASPAASPGHPRPVRTAIPGHLRSRWLPHAASPEAVMSAQPSMSRQSKSR